MSTATEPTTCTLHDGTQSVESLVRVVMLGVDALLAEGKIIPLYEAVCLARNPAHKPFGATCEPMRELKWLDDASPSPRLHRSIAEILRNVAHGDGMDMIFRDPRRS